jgi:hypothetical protein
MNQNDIEYLLELLDDAIAGQDWDLVEEARQYLEDFVNRKSSKYADEE